MSPELTVRQQELLDWFTREAPSLAAAYEGAVRLLANPDFPGRLHFISHAVRDIANRLVFIIDGELKRTRVQYENHLDRILDDWPHNALVGSIIDDSPSGLSTAESVSIPKHVYLELDQLVRQHRSRRSRSGFDLLFRALLRNDPVGGMVSRRLVATFKAEYAWFMQRAHLRESPPDPVAHAELVSHFSRFEQILHCFVGRFFTSTSELDAILREANASAD